MAQLPADRTKLAQAQGNMTPTFTASSQKLKDALTEAYDTVDMLNQKVNDHGAAATLPHADKSVTRAKLADKVIGAGQLDDAAVGQIHHQDNGIPSRAIGDNVILQRHMSDNSVGSAELQVGAVTATKIPNGTINSQHIDATLLASSASLATQAEFDKRGVNVQKYGAKGDDIANDTAAIQAAVDAVNAAGGGSVYFPYGTYKIGIISLVGMSNIHLFSNGATLKKLDDNTAILIDASSKITVEGIRIQGTNNTTAPSSNYIGHGVRVNNTDYFTIKYCEIFNMNNGGVMITESSHSVVLFNYFHDNHEGSDVYFGYGIPSKALSNFYAEGNKCYSNNRTGFYVMGYGEKVQIVNNDVRHKILYGIMVYDNEVVDYTNLWTDVIVTGNIVEDVSNAPDNSIMGGMGIYLQSIKKVVCSNNVVRNVLQGRTDLATPDRTLAPGAISINGTREVTCTGNTIDGSGMDGIDVVNVQQISRGSVVSNNVVLNVAYTGIYAQACQNVLIQGNMIAGASGANEGITIFSHSAQPTKNVMVSGNRVNGGFIKGITASKGTGIGVEGVTFQGNMVQDVSNTYMSISDGDKVSVNDNTIMNTLVAPAAGTYGIQFTRCNNFVMNANLLKGETAALLARGIACTSSTNGMITENVLVGVNEVSSSIVVATNTNVYLYSNLTPRQTMPMIGDHNIGNNPSTDTGIRLLYRATIPDAAVGSCSVGSICFNLAPVASGTAGWICVASGTPGTWKTFGTISA